MKILVSIKQVPSRDSQLRIDASGRWIQENDLGFEINAQHHSTATTRLDAMRLAA